MEFLLLLFGMHENGGGQLGQPYFFSSDARVPMLTGGASSQVAAADDAGFLSAVILHAKNYHGRKQLVAEADFASVAEVYDAALKSSKLT